MQLFFSNPNFYLDIEFEVGDVDSKQSLYSVSLFVADIKVAESTKCKPQSSVVKLEWKNNNQM